MAEPVLIDGQWRPGGGTERFVAFNPTTGEPLTTEFPVSPWSDCEAALSAAQAAFQQLIQVPTEAIGHCLDQLADSMEAARTDLVELAHRETGLPQSPRLAEVELPRTTMQLRLAAQAARDGSWRHAVIDTKAGIRAAYAGIGPVAVFGPNNFPFAFGSASGGDFAAALAAGNPVIAKANSSHPATTQRLAELAFAAVKASDLPPATIQLLYRTSHPDGARLVADAQLGATGYTGSRAAGLVLKEAADKAGKPIYLELSSVNPVVILTGALRERHADIVNEYVTSGLMGAGQFCTNPGLLVLQRGPEAERFVGEVSEKFRHAPVGTLLSPGVARALQESVVTLQQAGAQLLVGGEAAQRAGCCYANTLLRVEGSQFLRSPHPLQTEAFGNAGLVVVCNDRDEMRLVLQQLEGNLTGCIYSARDGQDDEDYAFLAPELRGRVGRLLNDKMPTGVAVSPAMNHGGPFPATGHPGFTAVGIPASLLRFAMLQCYDNVRPHRLPLYLRDPNPHGRMWRQIDGVWTQGDVGI